MDHEPAQIRIEYDPVRITGLLTTSSAAASIWERLRAQALKDPDAVLRGNSIELAWPNVLNILREFGSKSQQKALNFRFAPVGPASVEVERFVREVRSAASARNSLAVSESVEQISGRLREIGFKRQLRPFQLRDVQRLMSLPHGANFSVPGAGKTTVLLALYLLTTKPNHHLLVVAPKAAFPAWRGVLSECLDETSPQAKEPFTVLDGRADDIDERLRSGATRFIISYDLMVRNQDTVANYLARNPVHLVLDEAHRMKAGFASQRGAFLIGVSTLAARRDILTGTPMPQGPDDLAAQLQFLWPGQGLETRIRSGASPRDVLGNLYVRTTKTELGLPKATRQFRLVDMAPGQLALYGVVRDESLRQIARGINQQGVDYVRARRSVMRLLQLSANPVLAVQGITKDTVGIDSGIIDQVIAEGPSRKMRAVEAHVRGLAKTGKKCVVWTIFTDTILELERMLADLNPVTLYGAIPSGDELDLETREARLVRFHADPECMVMIANPAAAGEGISLHTVCHNAIYVDRSYVSTHYLQSIDRIHRLGLPDNTETNIYIYQTKAPPGLGSIDFSVNRRLAAKIRGLQQLLDDPDLHEIALDEENAVDPIDFDVDLQDLVDLVAELEGKEATLGSEE